MQHTTKMPELRNFRQFFADFHIMGAVTHESDDRASHQQIIKRRGFGVALFSVLLALGGSFGCMEPLEPSPIEQKSATAGALVYQMVCERLAFQAFSHDIAGRENWRCGFQDPPSAHLDASPTNLNAFSALEYFISQRQLVVERIDEIVAPIHRDHLPQHLRDFLTQVDSGNVNEWLPAIASSLKETANTEGFSLALLRLLRRPAFASAAHAPTPGTMLAQEPDFWPLVSEVLLHPNDLVTILAAFFAESSAKDVEQPYFLHPNVWLTSPPYLDPSLEPDDTYLRVARDVRGMPKTAPASSDAFAYFQDSDQDGLADIDESGMFLSPTNFVIKPFYGVNEKPPISRDQFGRPLTDTDELLFVYRDPAQTLLGQTFAAVGHWVREADGQMPAVLALVANALKPAHISKSSMGDTAAIAKVLAAPLALSKSQAGREVMTLFAETAAARPADIEQFFGVLALGLEDVAQEITDGNALKERNSMLMDFVRLTDEFLEKPALMHDLLQAFADLTTYELWPLMARMMRYKDPIDYNPTDLNGPPLGGFYTPVDRSLPDIEGNRSLFTRFSYLVSDGVDAKLCNREGAVLDLGFVRYPLTGSYKRCELFEVDNLAKFYMRAVVGEGVVEFKDPLVAAVANIDFLFEQLTGIDGFTRRPTPQAINRIVFAEPSAFVDKVVEPAKNDFGVEFRQIHKQTLFAAEKGNFYAAFEPIIAAFVRHKSTDLLVRFFQVIHKHWSSIDSDVTQNANPSAPAYAHGTGLVRFEETVARIIGDYEFFPAVGQLTGALLLRASNKGLDVEQLITNLHSSLFSPTNDPAFPQIIDDGRHVGQTLAQSPAVLSASGAQDAWRMFSQEHIQRTADALRGLSGLSRVVSKALPATDKSNTTGPPLFSAALSAVMEELARQESLGSLDVSLRHFEANLLSSRVNNGLVVLGYLLDKVLSKNDFTAATIERFMESVLLGYNAPESAAISLESLAYLLEATDDGDTQFVVQSMSQHRHGLVALFEFLRPLSSAASAEFGVEIQEALVRALQKNDNFESPLGQLLNVWVETNRKLGAAPALDDPKTAAEDVQALFESLADFVADEQTGLARLIAIVAGR